MKRLAEILTSLAVLGLPLVVAHYLFYSKLHVHPNDVGLDFSDLLARSFPGLVAIMVMTTALIIFLYSIVIWMNLVLMAFATSGTRPLAGLLSVVCLLTCMIFLLIRPLQGAAGWIGLGWLILITCLGLVNLGHQRWKDMAAGILLGAPMYVLLS